jgi:hypothetical protein
MEKRGKTMEFSTFNLKSGPISDILNY